MTKTSMCIGSASLKKGLSPCPADGGAEGTLPKGKERMSKYKTFAAAFSYPDAEFLTFFPAQKDRQKELSFEYDRLFRNNEVWLYSSEYKAENEFQRAENLADINGFYRAFALETNTDRPDALPCELEFMHYLIFKELHAKKSNLPDANEKITLCLDAQKKFFREHLYPAAKKISKAVISRTKNNFYREIARQLFTFVEDEAAFLKLS